MNIGKESKIDCHSHVLDPNRFPFADTFYPPSGPESSSVEQLQDVLDVYLMPIDGYGVAYGPLVTPNSGYGLDNRCLLDALERADSRLRGIALVSNGTGMDELKRLKASGLAGLAVNTTLLECRSSNSDPR